MATLHNLVDTNLLARLSQSDLNPLFLENVPSAREISDFFFSLEPLCYPHHLWGRFYICPRDGSLSIGHLPASAPHVPTVPCELHVVNTVHDYTFRSHSPYTSGWNNPGRVGNPDLIPVVLTLLDRLQRYLLSAKPHYLHFIHSDKGPSKHDIYTVEVARRVKTEREPDVGDTDIEKWPGQTTEDGRPDRSRRKASRTDITLWAVLYLVDTNPNLDTLRLAHIRAAICAVSPPAEIQLHQENQQQAYSDILPHVEFRGLNLAALLRSRPARYRDGRARFPLISAVVKDQSLLRPSSAVAVPSVWGSGMQPRRLFPESARPVAQALHPPEYRCNIARAACVVITSVVIPAFGFLTLLRLQRTDDSEKDDVAGLALTIFFNLLPISFFCVLHIVLGPQTHASQLLRRNREATAPELLRWAECQPANSGARAMVVRTRAARKYWDGELLCFAGGTFEGENTFGGPRFWVSELLNAGFKTGFTMGGREVLVTPEGERLVLHGVGNGGKGVFTKLVENESVESQFVTERRARWWSDIEIGCQRDLGDKR